MRLQIFNRIKELLGGLKNTNNKNVFNTIYIFKIDYIIQKNNHNRKSVLLHPLSGLRLLFL